jgi:hypothetical protein
MATVQKIFDMAIHLMDEQNESTGETGTVDTQEYKFRTISILNSVIPALRPYSEQPWKDRTAAVLYAGEYKNPKFDQEIPLDDTLCFAVLPYYLASQLLSGENEDLAAWFMGRYREAFMEVRNKIPASFEPVNTPYGLF